MLRVLAGLQMPSSGTVMVDGVDATLAPDAMRKRIGFLPEDPPLYREMRVSEFLRWVGQVKGCSRAQVDAELPKVVETCQLGEVTEHGDRRAVARLPQARRHRAGDHPPAQRGDPRRADQRPRPPADRRHALGGARAQEVRHRAHQLAHPLRDRAERRSHPGDPQGQDRRRGHRAAALRLARQRHASHRHRAWQGRGRARSCSARASWSTATSSPRRRAASWSTSRSTLKGDNAARSSCASSSRPGSACAQCRTRWASSSRSSLQLTRAAGAPAALESKQLASHDTTGETKAAQEANP